MLNARGLFDAHRALAYDQFLANLEAGRVERIVQWRNQLEVMEQGTLRSVVVPADRDLPADLAQARAAGHIGINYQAVPDAWLGTTIPWIPVLLTLVALLIWFTAVVWSRRLALGSGRAGRPQTAS